MKKQIGFTLIELMIVIAIIGVIGAIAYPSYNSYMTKSKRADAKVGLALLADRQERFYVVNNTYTTSFGAGGLNTSNTSKEGYYTFTIPNADATGFTLTASRVGGANADNDCVTMSLSSTGAKTATAGGGGDPSKCW